VFTEEFQVRLKRSIMARKTNQWPPVVTHDMWEDANDPVLKHLRHRNLLNAPGDPVKVVFHPDFVSLSSLFSLDYDQFVRGCHMGIFPSYYEPWGYTPLECLALGLPTVTTDLSGFGAYVEKHVPDALQNGVLVLNRSKSSTEACIEQLRSFLLKFCDLNRRERISLRNRAERLTERFTWDIMAAHYHRAHAEALKRISASEVRVPSYVAARNGVRAQEANINRPEVVSHETSSFSMAQNGVNTSANTDATKTARPANN